MNGTDDNGGPECPYCDGTGVITYAELERLRECERDRTVIDYIDKMFQGDGDEWMAFYWRFPDGVSFRSAVIQTLEQGESK